MKKRSRIRSRHCSSISKRWDGYPVSLSLVNLCQKERQVESIVEKLCQRFRFTEEPRQWRDIAYCLSLLPFKSERSVKKLIEGLQFYRDKLHEPIVFERFTEILTKVSISLSW